MRTKPRAGYVNAGPARAHTHGLLAGSTVRNVAVPAQSSQTAIIDLVHARYENIDAALADRLLKLTRADVAPARQKRVPGELIPQALEVDEVLLERIVSGRSFDIPRGETFLYARELLLRGWSKTDAARRLRMSGYSIKSVADSLAVAS